MSLMTRDSSSVDTAIVLGGTDDHRHLMKLLRLRAFRVVLVDNLSNPIAKHDCDEHIQADAFNSHVVMSIAQQYNTKLVIAACIDQAVHVACQVSEWLRLPAPFSADLAAECSNKLSMKRVMASAGIPSARFVEVAENQFDAIRTLEMPIVVKPADSHGSWGVHKVRSYDDVATYIKKAVEISRTGQAIAEEFIEGDEVSIDAVITNDDVIVLACSQLWRWEVNRATRVICQAETSAALLETHRHVIEPVVKQIASVFGIRNSPLLVQGILGPNGLAVVEFAPRVGGGSKYCDVLHQTGTDLVESVIDSYLGNPLQVSPVQADGVQTRTYVYGGHGQVASYSGFEDCVRSGHASDVRIYKSCGEQVAEVLASKDRLASFRVTGDSTASCADIVARIASQIDVVDPDGRSLVKRNWMLGPWI